MTAAARLCGWVDFNKNNNFQNGFEESCVNVASGATSATLNWTGISGLTTGTTTARFRLGYTASQVNSPTGPADSGEVEDYAVTITTPAAPTATNDSVTTPQNVNVSVNPFTNDSAVLGFDATTVVLRDPADNTFKKSVTIAGQGTWTVNATTGVVTFDPITTFVGAATTLTYRAPTPRPHGHRPAATTVTAVTPDAVNDTRTTAYNTAVAVDVKANDTAGNAAIPLDATSVRLLDPADSTYKTSVTLAGKGTFVVNTTTGVVTFTPVAGYVGTAGPLYLPHRRHQRHHGHRDPHGHGLAARRAGGQRRQRHDTAERQRLGQPAHQRQRGSRRDPGADLGPPARPGRQRLQDDGHDRRPGHLHGQHHHRCRHPRPGACLHRHATALTYRVTDSTGQNATSTIAVTVTPITPTAVDNSAAASFNTAVRSRCSATTPRAPRPLRST